VSVESYAIRAKQHAPKTIEEARAAAQRLLAEGYNDHGAAAALGVSVEQIRRMIGECSSCDR
jgi:transposase